MLVPLVREKSHHITVEARLGGRPARFIVDTGAGGTIVDSSAAPRYKLDLRARSQRATGVGASVAMSSVAKHDLALAGVDLSETKLRTLDLSHVNAGLGKAGVRPVVGVLGADVLWRHKAVIDYEKGLMLFFGKRRSGR